MSSALGGDILMVPLQRIASLSIGLPLPWMIACQAAASAIASLLSPGSLLLVATALEIRSRNETDKNRGKLRRESRANWLHPHRVFDEHRAVSC